MVHCNAQRLKGTAGRVLVFAAFRRGHGAGHDICQLQGRFDGRILPCLHDPARDLPCERFFAVIPQNACQLFAALGVHKVRCRFALLAHPHVQRCICTVGKAAGRIVQLMAGNAQIQQRAVDLVDAKAFQSLSGIAEVDLHHRGRQARKAGTRGLHRVRVLIQRDQPAALFCVQPQGDLAGMSRAACGAIKVGAGRINGKPLQTLVQQNGDMLKRGRVKGCLCFKFHRCGLLSQFISFPCSGHCAHSAHFYPITQFYFNKSGP